jgi:hypothetical protein
MWTIRCLGILCILTALSCSVEGFVAEPQQRAFLRNSDATRGKAFGRRPPNEHHLPGRSVPKRETRLSLHQGLLQEALSVSMAPTTADSPMMNSLFVLSALPTLDPTTALTDVLGTVLNTPLILAIPIVAALLVATLIAYLIVAYAQPAEDE